MSFDSQRPSRSGSGQDLWPKWMWVAVPVLVVVVVAGLWWAIFSPSDIPATPTPTATMKPIQTQPTQAPTVQNTLPAAETTSTRQILPAPATFTPTPLLVTTPTTERAVESTSGLGIGGKVKVKGTSGQGLNMRSGAGTGHARIKTLPEGSELEIIGGPKEANDYTWWQVRDEAGTSGWVVSEFLDSGK